MVDFEVAKNYLPNRIKISKLFSKSRSIKSTGKINYLTLTNTPLRCTNDLSSN